MLYYAAVFFVIALIAAVFGFGASPPAPRTGQDPVLRRDGHRARELPRPQPRRVALNPSGGVARRVDIIPFGARRSAAVTTEPHLAPSARWGRARPSRASPPRPLARRRRGRRAGAPRRFRPHPLEPPRRRARPRNAGSMAALRHAAPLADGARDRGVRPDSCGSRGTTPLRPPRTFALAAPVRPAAFRPDGARLAVWRHANLHSTEALDLDVFRPRARRGGRPRSAAGAYVVGPDGRRSSRTATAAALARGRRRRAAGPRMEEPPSSTATAR